MAVKKLLILAILVLIVLLTIIFIVKQPQSKNQRAIKQEFQQQFLILKSQYVEAKAKGYDVSEAERLAGEAKMAFEKKDYGKANELLNSISKILADMKIPGSSASPMPLLDPTVSPGANKIGCGNGICESGECDSCADCEVKYVLPDNMAAKYNKEYEKMAAWLNDKVVEWKPAVYEPMHFMGLLLTLTSTYLEDTAAEDDLKFIEMFDEAGVDIVTIPITGAPEDLSSSLIARIDKAVSEIRKRGKEVKVWSRSYTYPAKIRAQKMNSSAEYIVSRWHPEYYTIVHEPECDTPQGMQANKETIEGIISIIKKIYPDTKIVAGVLAYQGRMNCVDYYVDIAGLDIISMDVYNNGGLCEECTGGNLIEAKINLAHSKGKQVWFEEFWSSTQQDKTTSDEYDIAPGFNDSKRAWRDSQFINVIAYYAQKNDLIGIEPWFNNNFFFYSGYYPYGTALAKDGNGMLRFSEQYLRDLRAAMAEKRRTPAFCAFKDIIKKVNQK